MLDFLRWIFCPHLESSECSGKEETSFITLLSLKICESAVASEAPVLSRLGARFIITSQSSIADRFRHLNHSKLQIALSFLSTVEIPDILARPT